MDSSLIVFLQFPNMSKIKGVGSGSGSGSVSLFGTLIRCTWIRNKSFRIYKIDLIYRLRTDWLRQPAENRGRGERHLRGRWLELQWRGQLLCRHLRPELLPHPRPALHALRRAHKHPHAHGGARPRDVQRPRHAGGHHWARGRRAGPGATGAEDEQLDDGGQSHPAPAQHPAHPLPHPGDDEHCHGLLHAGGEEGRRGRLQWGKSCNNYYEWE